MSKRIASTERRRVKEIRRERARPKKSAKAKSEYGARVQAARAQNFEMSMVEEGRAGGDPDVPMALDAGKKGKTRPFVSAALRREVGTKKSKPPITDEIINALAAKTATDPRSYWRRLAGLPVRGRRGEIVDRSLREAGYEPRS